MAFHAFDENYLRQLAEGDTRAQEHFVYYFSQLIQLKLAHRLHSQSEIEDVRQETFSRVFSALSQGKLRHPERLGAFVNSVCNNVLLEYYRSAHLEAPPEDEEELDPPDKTIDLIGALATKQMKAKVRKILDELPERDRRLIREVFLEERDKDEICRDLGVDREYFRVLLIRAKRSFKSKYLKATAAHTEVALEGRIVH